MKINMKKRAFTFLMILVMVISLVACGSKSIAGNYKLTEIESYGEKMSVEDLANLLQMDIDMTLNLKSDKSFVWDTGFWGEDESVRGSWQIEGDSLILIVEGEELYGTFDGKNINMDFEGEIFIFEKQ